jgi:hypothetical protein
MRFALLICSQKRARLKGVAEVAVLYIMSPSLSLVRTESDNRMELVLPVLIIHSCGDILIRKPARAQQHL